MSRPTEYTIKPGSDLQITRWESHDDHVGVMYSVLKHDNAYTVHRRYETPDVTAIYSILRLRSGYRIGMVSKPLQELIPSLSEIDRHISEGFDIGIMMAEIDGSESWEDLQDSDLNDIIDLNDRGLLTSLRKTMKDALFCKICVLLLSKDCTDEQISKTCRMSGRSCEDLLSLE